jgi:hypothetical protein
MKMWNGISYEYDGMHIKEIELETVVRNELNIFNLNN